MTPPTHNSRVLQSMLDRLFSAIMTGPGMNCRPHNSRQRVDLDSLKNLKSLAPSQVLKQLLSDSATASIESTITAPKSVQAKAARRFGGTKLPTSGSSEPATPESDAEKKAREDWNNQQSVLHKLRLIADEAQTYENDTGVDVLHMGFPLLSIPPGVPGPDGQPSTRRVLAPVCFMPISISIKSGGKATLELSCTNDDIDRVQPNQSLLAWAEQATGKRPELAFADDDGSNPWREVCELVKVMAAAAKVPIPPLFEQPEIPEDFKLDSTPRTDDLPEFPAFIISAVLGLFPVSNQSLLRDTREMMLQPELQGPVQSFIKHDTSGISEPPPPTAERLVAPCDPCQSRAVDLARTSPVLVVHGPPGTGKSQTITNIIGDHLSRGERVLFVCDKRTAIDVVANRLEALGLGSLSAVVHDPQRDQKPLYMSIRAQLDGLTESTIKPAAEKELARIDTELSTLLHELGEYHRGLMQVPAGKDVSLSELIGRWLTIRGPATQSIKLDDAPLHQVSQVECDRCTVQLRETFDRAAAIDYPANPWRTATNSTLDAFMSVPINKHRDSLNACCSAAAAADEQSPAESLPSIPNHPLTVQAGARGQLADQLKAAISSCDQNIRTFWANATRERIATAYAAVTIAEPQAEYVSALQADPQLYSTLQASTFPLPTLSQHILALERYLPTATAWWGFLAFGRKSAATRVLSGFGLPTDAASAATVLAHLKAFRAAAILDDSISRATGQQQSPVDPVLCLARYAAHVQVIKLLHATACSGFVSFYFEAAQRELAGAQTGTLKQSSRHLDALVALQASLQASRLFDQTWIESELQSASAAATASRAMNALRDSFETLDDCLRISDSLTTLPSGIAGSAKHLLEAGTPAPVAMKWLQLGVLAGEIARRLDAAPKLKTVDSRRIDTIFARVRELDAAKRDLCRDLVMHLWTSRCRERLLALTGSRLNSDGAAVKQRLFVKGTKALRLRQVIAMGAAASGGDPLMDLRPVWMASPETVAQLFPRTPLFDAVIFDEASQVRLEEALPVLTRGKRIIIAGDPKQLPPTRFFESTIAETQSEAAENDADLFEQVQADTEDLLSAALSMNVQQSYLDVHYRSRSGDLIEFSNQYFYSSRLQAIPGHPSRKTILPPLKLVPVEGVYEDRTNQIEAQAVVALVKELLDKPEPPSIGIGCFNITQRDLVTELLDEAASENKAFGAKLADARSRRSSKSFEGLFVKNLENVQGDERDHIIISTTYGPDPSGKFYRRFGPLAQPGGGRRLNVLVTRARQEVHVITSIPASAYRSLPPVPEGTVPGGAWLLFSYLKFAEDLALLYEHSDAIEEETKSEELVTRHASTSPSALPEALALHLAEQSKLSSTVYWGNEGFRIDIATPSPDGGSPNPLGILADFSRFSLAGDPVKWDIFRTDILTQLGWQIQRVWSPSLVRDPDGTLTLLSQKARPGTNKSANPAPPV